MKRRQEAVHIHIYGTVVGSESKEDDLWGLREDGDGSEGGGCIEDDGLLELDLPGGPFLLAGLAYHVDKYYVHLHVCNLT